MTTNLKRRTFADLKFPEFDDIKVSTKTIIAKTNMTIDLRKLFDYLPITNYIVFPKKRGRKKKIEKVEEKIIIESGSIITLKYENDVRGVEIKKKKIDKKKKSKWFRNSFTVVMVIDNKPINFKICQNGMMQITGCKFDSQAEDCVKFIWYYIKEQKENQNIGYVTKWHLDKSKELMLSNDNIRKYEILREISTRNLGVENPFLEPKNGVRRARMGFGGAKNGVRDAGMGSAATQNGVRAGLQSSTISSVK